MARARFVASPESRFSRSPSSFRFLSVSHRSHSSLCHRLLTSSEPFHRHCLVVSVFLVPPYQPRSKVLSFPIAQAMLSVALVGGDRRPCSSSRVPSPFPFDRMRPECPPTSRCPNNAGRLADTAIRNSVLPSVRPPARYTPIATLVVHTQCSLVAQAPSLSESLELTWNTISAIREFSLLHPST